MKKITKGLKKLSCILLISSIIVSNLVVVQAKTNLDLGDFDLIKYKADINTNSSYSPYTNLQYKLTNDTPSTVICKELEENAQFISAVAGWETATFDPSNTTDDQLSQIDHYESIIISILKIQTEAETFIDFYNSQTAKDTKSLISKITKVLKEQFNIEFSSLEKQDSLSKDEKALVSKGFEEWLKVQHPGFVAIEDGLGKFSEFMDTYNKVTDAIENYTTYLNCYSLSQEIKNVISDLYKRSTDNYYLHTALEKVNIACESMSGALASTSFDVTTSSFSQIYKQVVGEMWNAVLSSTALGNMVLIGQKIGKEISNVLFSTEATIEQYYKMRALREFENVLKESVRGFQSVYLSNKDSQSARNLFAATDILYAEYDLSCDFSKNYADILFNNNITSLVRSIFNGESENYHNYLNSVANIKEYNKDSWYRYNTDYMFFLKEDYPDIYNLINNLDSVYESVDVSSISFEKESVEWGLQDTIYSYSNVIVTPDNASNKSITYESSDESIVSYNATGRVKVYATGTATITATSINGKTATMKVNVVEGNGADSSNLIGTTVDDIIDDNFEYRLLENGTIEITKYIGSDTRVTIPSYIGGLRVTSIGSSAFQGCTTITDIVIPGNVAGIGYRAFYNCTSLKNVEIQDGVTSIGQEAFRYCGELERIIIPSTVVLIGQNAFSNCEKLILFVYSNSNALDYADNNSLKYVIISSYVDKTTNISVESGTVTNLGKNSNFVVSQITNGKSFDLTAKSFDNFNLYEIGFEEDGSIVAIDGMCIVKIPVSAGMNIETCKVYYLNDENQFIDMRAVYKDGYMVFQTDHFSKYIVTDSPIREVLLGDINGDDLINYNDAVLVLQADSKLIELTETQRKAADVNQDGIVNYNDAVQILRKDAGLITDF